MNKEDLYLIGESSARSRAKIYELLERVFIRLPDAVLAEEILSSDFSKFLSVCGSIGNLKLRKGIALVESYRSAVQSSALEDIANEIAVDRTGILRTHADKSLKLPYESLYMPAPVAGDVVAGVKAFYRKAGIIPEEDIGEMLDYLGVEIDFMYQLCLREIEQWSCRGDVVATIQLENEFLRNHLGRWVNFYCDQAQKFAVTKFYQGFLNTLGAFIEIEMEYLGSIGV